MQFSTILLLATSASALALPTQPESHNNTTMTILPRYTKGADVAAYVEGTCNTVDAKSSKHYGPPHGGHCFGLNDMTTNNIGINWGGAFNTVGNIHFYKDKDCKQYVYEIDNPTWMNPEGGAGTCLDMAKNHGPYLSMMTF